MKAKKLTQILAIVLLLGGMSPMVAYGQSNPAPTQPETRQRGPIINLAEVTCQSVINMSEQDRIYTLVFYHGYFSGKDNDRLINTAQLTEITSKIAAACEARPETPLMQVFARFRSTAQK
jgi:hypothetical protein